MRRTFKVVLALGGIFLLVISVGVGAFFYAPSRTPRTNEQHVLGLSQFVVLKEGNLYSVRFSLVGNDYAWATSDATVNIAIRLANGTELYAKQFNILSTDFQTYQLRSTGEQLVAYSWQIDGTGLKYGELDLPKAYLAVTLPDGRIFDTNSTIL